MKPWWQSKTIWANLVMATLAVVPMMDPALMPKGAWPWILLGTNLANAWLRVIHSTVIATPSRTE